MKRLMAATAFAVAVFALPAWAQAPAGHDHSSDGEKSTPPAASQPGTTTSRGGGMGGMMKGMMGNMPMMQMMETMQASRMMGPGMGGMTTIDHVEGRIAFLRAELRITDAQTGAWNGFADALRANAKKLAEVRASMTPKPDVTQTMADRLALQEKWLLARLEGTMAIRSAYIKLDETLADDQRKSAADLVAPHVGLGMMAMTAGQMPQGQAQGGQTQGRQTEPGKMHGPMHSPRTENR